MAPNIASPAVEEHNHVEPAEEKPLEPVQIVWRNVFLFLGLHIAAVYGLVLIVLNASLNSWLYGKSYKNILGPFPNYVTKILCLFILSLPAHIYVTGCYILE